MAKWTKEKLQEIANLCETRTEMAKKFPNAYAAAGKTRMNCMEELFKNHERKGLTLEYWTVEKIQALADKCKTRNEMEKKYRNAYAAIKFSGKTVDYFFRNHENKGLKNQQWTVEKLQAIADKCKTRKEMGIKYPNAYRVASRRKIIDELFKNHERKGLTLEYWTVEKIQAFADKCETRNEMKKKYYKAYFAIRKSGKTVDYYFRNHENQGHALEYWTVKKIQAIADKCETRKEMVKKYPNAYAAIKFSGKTVDYFFRNHKYEGFSDSHGFNPNKPAYFYIYGRPDGYLKYGIGENAKTRMKTDCKEGEMIYSISCEDGKVIQNIERAIKKSKKLVTNQAKIDGDYFEGYTETTVKTDKALNILIDIAENSAIKQGYEVS